MSLVKLVIQQCTSATLKHTNQPNPKSIGHGMVVYVCFMKGASTKDVERAVDVVSKVKLCEDEGEQKRVDIFEKAGDLMIIPQATLGGKLKGKSLQYHGNVGKEEGQILYDSFCKKLRDLFLGVERRIKEHVLETTQKCECGLYGERQILSMETNGPYTHEFAL